MSSDEKTKIRSRPATPKRRLLTKTTVCKKNGRLLTRKDPFQGHGHTTPCDKNDRLLTSAGCGLEETPTTRDSEVRSNSNQIKKNDTNSFAVWAHDPGKSGRLETTRTNSRTTLRGLTRNVYIYLLSAVRCRVLRPSRTFEKVCTAEHDGEFFIIYIYLLTTQCVYNHM